MALGRYHDSTITRTWESQSHIYLSFATQIKNIQTQNVDGRPIHNEKLRDSKIFNSTIVYGQNAHQRQQKLSLIFVRVALNLR